jgi:cell wall-associated NlpC family hydrolase
MSLPALDSISTVSPLRQALAPSSLGMAKEVGGSESAPGDSVGLSNAVRESVGSLPNLSALTSSMSEQPGPAAARRADFAESVVGQKFKPGEKFRCADFVSTAIRQSGTAPEGFKHNVLADNFRTMGTPIKSVEDLKRGDIINFKETYKAKHGRPSTHTGVYLGDGKFAHRTTMERPEVKVNSLDDKLKTGKSWGAHFLQGSRFEGNSTGEDQKGVKFAEFKPSSKGDSSSKTRVAGSKKSSSSRSKTAQKTSKPPKPASKPSNLVAKK